MTLHTHVSGTLECADAAQREKLREQTAICTFL